MSAEPLVQQKRWFSTLASCTGDVSCAQLAGLPIHFPHFYVILWVRMVLARGETINPATHNRIYN